MADSMIVAWLAQKRIATWGKPFGLHDGSITDAADWFEKEITDYEQYRARVVAGQAINAIAAGYISEYNEREYSPSEWGWIDQLGPVMGRDLIPPSQSAPSHGTVTPSDPQGHLHPEGTAGTSGDTYPSGDAGADKGDGSLPAHDGGGLDEERDDQSAGSGSE